MKELQFDKFFLSSNWNLETVSWDYDSLWQILSVGKIEFFTQATQIQLSLKLKNISDLFSAYLKSTWNFEHFEKKGEPHCWCTSEIIEYKKEWLLKCLKGPMSEQL